MGIILPQGEVTGIRVAGQDVALVRAAGVDVWSAAPAGPILSTGTGNRVTGSSTSLSTSWSHTITTSGSDVVVMIATAQSMTSNTATDPPTVTYGGVSCTRLITRQLGTGINRQRVSIFYLWNPPTGTQTVAANYAGLTVKTAVAGQSVAIGGVTNFGTPLGTSTTSTSPGSTANSVVFSAHVCDAPITGNSGTDHYTAGSTVDGAGDYICVQTAPGTGSAVTMSVTSSASLATSVGVAVQP